MVSTMFSYLIYFKLATGVLHLTSYFNLLIIRVVPFRGINCFCGLVLHRQLAPGEQFCPLEDLSHDLSGFSYPAAGYTSFAPIPIRDHLPIGTVPCHILPFFPLIERIFFQKVKQYENMAKFSYSFFFYLRIEVCQFGFYKVK